MRHAAECDFAPITAASIGQVVQRLTVELKTYGIAVKPRSHRTNNAT